jgi:hypothetical protein
MWVRALPVSECFDVLGAHRFAHLGCAKKGPGLSAFSEYA